MIGAFLRDRRGTTAIEYAVIAALIFMVIIAAIQPISGSLASIFGNSSEAMNNAVAG